MGISIAGHFFGFHFLPRLDPRYPCKEISNRQCFVGPLPHFSNFFFWQNSTRTRAAFSTSLFPPFFIIGNCFIYDLNFKRWFEHLNLLSFFFITYIYFMTVPPMIYGYSYFIFFFFISQPKVLICGYE